MFFLIFSSLYITLFLFFFFSSRRRHTRYWRDWSSDVCSSDLREAYGYLLAARRGAREQKVREVHARYQQHEPDRRHQHGREAHDRAAQLRHDEARRDERDSLPLVRVRVLFAETLRQVVQRGFGLLARHSVLKSSDGEDVLRRAPFEPGVARLNPLLHRHRHPDLGRVDDLRADEALGHHADRKSTRLNSSHA